MIATNSDAIQSIDSEMSKFKYDKAKVTTDNDTDNVVNI